MVRIEANRHERWRERVKRRGKGSLFKMDTVKMKVALLDLSSPCRPESESAQRFSTQVVVTLSHLKEECAFNVALREQIHYH